MKIKTIQNTIPIHAVHENDKGIIETEPGTYTKSYFLRDINYQTAGRDEKEFITENYKKIFNSMAEGSSFAFTINNKNIDEEAFERETLIKEMGDHNDYYRKHFNDYLINNIKEGTNNIRKDKYLTISLQEENYQKAATSFISLDTELQKNIKAIATNSSEVFVLKNSDRLEILHDMYNVGHEGEFVSETRIDGRKVEFFDIQNIREMGLGVRDIIAPSSYTLDTDYLKIGDKYVRTLFLSKLPRSLSDKFISDITTVDFNMITTMNFKVVPQDKANLLVEQKKSDINDVIEKQEQKTGRHNHKLQDQAEEVEILRQELRTGTQKFFLLTMVVAVFADSVEQLKENCKELAMKCRKHMCKFETLKNLQEQGFNAVLPLCINQIPINKLLNTSSIPAFQVYDSLEVSDKGGLPLSMNAITNNIVKINRKAYSNFNGWVLGMSGMGKSFAVKQLLLLNFLSGDSDIVIIDPESEYGPICEALGGQVIKIAPGGENYINPMDMVQEKNTSIKTTLSTKIEFLNSLIKNIMDNPLGLGAVEKSIIARSASIAYKDFFAHNLNPEYLPTLKDFRNIIAMQPEFEAAAIAGGLELYTQDAFDLFAHKTNLDVKNRLIVFDIKDIGDTMYKSGMFIILDFIWNKLSGNRFDGKDTHIIIDEAHLLFNDDTIIDFLKGLFKRARKYNGIVTCITQNISDLLENAKARNMLNNSSFIQILAQAALDANELCALFNISDALGSFIRSSTRGQGLFKAGNAIVPFSSSFPKDNPCYKVLTSDADELKAFRDSEMKKSAKSRKISS